jgi:eukaryotic-like serine/threonine-protein kinase
MPLSPGTKLGPYEILSPLGSGGMGEVYRARDTRLDRPVAIKILPAHLSSDPVRKQRFEREAKTISNLNHPNICTLYDVGSLDGLDYLVMECVEGESLAQRLEKGPLPADQVLKIGAEIADALDKAHRNGIVHRDLKPANIMLTKSGAKLLDFGLAKPTAPQATLATLTSAAPQQSPVTQEGNIVGTFQYMSPEQIEAKELDGRSDIFSLGAVLYEMLTGKRAFEGKSQLSVASAILEKDPEPITMLVPLTPPALDHAVRRCLAKDPEDRWQTARDLSLELKWLATPASTDSARPIAAPSKPKDKFRKYLPYLIEALTIIAIAYFFTARPSRTNNSDLPILRASILPPEKTQFASIETDEGGVPAVSPDGRFFVSPVHDADGKVRLWLRALQSGEGKILPGTEGSGHAFWSPDNRSIGFFSTGKLKRIDIDGASVYNIADASLGRGGSWNSDGTIIFSPSQSMPILKVPATGGTPVDVTKLDPANGVSSHRWPQFLPDGRHFLFILRSEKSEQTGLYLASLSDPEPHMILRTSFNALYVSPGYILYVRDETLFAQKFDLGSFKLSGDPISLPDRVGLFSPALNALFSASNTGVLTYYPAQSGNGGTDMVWYDRAGKRSDTLAQLFLAGFSISPDGSTVALSAYAPNEWIPKLWKYDLQRGTKTPLSQSYGSSPVWTPDGQSIYFARYISNIAQIHKVNASGGDEQTVLTTDGFSQSPTSICSDGKTLLYGQSPVGDPQQGTYWALALNGGSKPFLVIPADQRPSRGTLSPDCNWVAYESRVTADREISIIHFPDGAPKYQVSTSGGFNPQWRRDGKELFFYSPQDSSVSSVTVQEKGRELVLSKPIPLFHVHPFAPRLGVFEATPDGQKFLVSGDTTSLGTVPLSIVQNWDATLPH